jgi:predicted hydrocarbon binding protein
MTENFPAPGKETEAPGAAQGSGDGFRPDLPLAILESVRQHDRPAEVLEDEDLAASLPRRLGLTGVVESQIHRYHIARKRRERVSTDDVVSLLRLVLRRPDAEAILQEAGRDVARHQGRGALYRLAGIARLLPYAISSRMAKRTISRLMGQIGGGAPVRVTRNPLRVRVEHPVTARESLGLACILYSAAIEEAAQHAMGRRPSVVHVGCEGRGDEACVWEVE